MSTIATRIIMGCRICCKALALKRRLAPGSRCAARAKQKAERKPREKPRVPGKNRRRTRATVNRREIQFQSTFGNAQGTTTKLQIIWDEAPYGLARGGSGAQGGVDPRQQCGDA